MCVNINSRPRSVILSHSILTLRRINNQVLCFMSKVSLLKINGSKSKQWWQVGVHFMYLLITYWGFVYFLFLLKRKLFVREILTFVYPDHSVFLLTRTFCVVIFLISVYISLYMTSKMGWPGSIVWCVYVRVGDVIYV